VEEVAVKRIAELLGQPLSWTQPSGFDMDYELRAGGEIAATLSFRSRFGTFATASSGDGIWTFKRVGFWSTRVTVRGPDDAAELGNFKNNTWRNGGTLTLPGDRQLRATTNFWKTNLEFQDESGTSLIRFKSRGIVRMAADVELDPRAIDIPEMRWILMLGCYLCVMMRMDAAGDAAGAAAAASG
jgi:hypothetical protein